MKKKQVLKIGPTYTLRQHGASALAFWLSSSDWNWDRTTAGWKWLRWKCLGKLWAWSLLGDNWDLEIVGRTSLRNFEVIRIVRCWLDNIKPENAGWKSLRSGSLMVANYWKEKSSGWRIYRFPKHTAFSHPNCLWKLKNHALQNPLWLIGAQRFNVYDVKLLECC